MAVIVQVLTQAGAALWLGLAIAAAVISTFFWQLRSNAKNIALVAKGQQENKDAFTNAFLELNKTIRQYSTGEISTVDGRVTKIKNGVQDKQIEAVQALAEKAAGQAKKANESTKELGRRIQNIEKHLAGDSGAIKRANAKAKIYHELAED